MSTESTIFVVYATDANDLVPLPEGDLPSEEVPAFTSRRAANSAARRIVEDGAIGAIVVQDAAIVGHFGKRPKFAKPERGGEAEEES